MQTVGYFLHRACITIAWGFEILLFCWKLEFFHEQETGSVATEYEKIISGFRILLILPTWVWLTVFLKLDRRPHSRPLTTNSQEMGMYYYAVSFPFHVFSLTIIFHFYLQFQTGSRKACGAVEKSFSQGWQNSKKVHKGSACAFGASFGVSFESR